MEDFGQKLIELRKKNDLSQEQLAHKVNVSRQTVSKWETDQSAPSPANIRALCEVFGVPLSYFLSEEPQEASEISVTQSTDGERETKKNFRLARNIFLFVFGGIVIVILGTVIVGACCVIFDSNKGVTHEIAVQTYPEIYILIGACIVMAALLYWLIYFIITRIKLRKKKK